MTKVTLVKVSSQQRQSQKNGKQYESVGILTKEYGDKWINGFGNSRTKNWKKDDVVEIEITQNGEYLNFKTPSEHDEIMDALRTVYAEIIEIKKLLNK